jgi:beta-ribofuranosylaminobenzene 5'-phosphate synthase
MKLKILTPSRLHFSLIDLNGELGRVDGGLGLTLKEPNIEIIVQDNLEKQSLDSSLEPTNVSKSIKSTLGNIIIINECKNDNKDPIILTVIEQIVQNFIANIVQANLIQESLIKDKFPLTIRIIQYLKPHMGLGSTTQMSLAIAYGINKALKLDMDISNLAKYVKRGGTSGIGCQAFEQGGFILDSGHRFGKGQEKETFVPSSVSKASPAKTLLRYDFPEDWIILLTILHVPAGAANNEEVSIFQRYCPIQIEDVQKICHRILMQLLPGLIEHDLESFGKALHSIQSMGFKQVEINLQHPAVRDLIEFQKQNGVKCVGMSSFGPTVFSIFENKSDANTIVGKIFKKFSSIGFDSYITQADNKGFFLKDISQK